MNEHLPVAKIMSSFEDESQKRESQHESISPFNPKSTLSTKMSYIKTLQENKKSLPKDIDLSTF